MLIFDDLSQNLGFFEIFPSSVPGRMGYRFPMGLDIFLYPTFKWTVLGAPEELGGAPQHARGRPCQ